MVCYSRKTSSSSEVERAMRAHKTWFILVSIAFLGLAGISGCMTSPMPQLQDEAVVQSPTVESTRAVFVAATITPTPTPVPHRTLTPTPTRVTDSQGVDAVEMVEIPVGEFRMGKPLNPFDNGEWVADWYAEDYYTTSPEQNPTGPDEGTKRVIRGSTLSQFWNAAYRHARPQSFAGFRCAYSTTE